MEEARQLAREAVQSDSAESILASCVAFGRRCAPELF
jgi:hypothetical protein